ncbi:MAG: shikimate dehydrogenase [Casimicrobium sp.]
MRRTDKYAVFGNPIAHSKSPRIHALFAASLNQHIDYQKRLAPIGNFAGELQRFFDEGGVGANVTVPFKRDAFALARSASLRAQQAGAANFLIWRDDHWFCDNTDGAGLVRDIETNLHTSLKDKNVLLLGAGGAARGVIGPLFLRSPRQIVVVNRTFERATELVSPYKNEFAARALSVDALVAESMKFDVVINATSSSLTGSLPLPENAHIFAPDALAYDMMYGKQPTIFMNWASAQGAVGVADGLGMLVEQAAESYLQWRGELPHAAPIIAQLRAELARE